MSDIEDDFVENPDPESDISPEASSDLNTAPESEADSGGIESAHVRAVSPELDQEFQDIQQEAARTEENGDAVSADRLEEPEGHVELNKASASIDHELVTCEVDSSLAEGDQNQACGGQVNENGHCADHLTEGDQHFAIENSTPSRQNDGPDLSQAVSHDQNELAAEDEQFFAQSNEVDFSGAEWSLEPEENSQTIPQSTSDTCDAAEGAEVDVEEMEPEGSANAPARTESSAQLVNWNAEGGGAEAFNENIGVESYGVESETSEAEGASAIIVEHLTQCEAEAEQVVVKQGSERNDFHAASLNSNTENLPAEDNIVNNEVAFSSPDDTPAAHSESHVQVSGQHEVEESISPEQVAEQSMQGTEGFVPEDEISVLDYSGESKVVCCSESYQPECDQSSESSTPVDSSPSHISQSELTSDSNVSDSPDSEESTGNINVSKPGDQGSGSEKSQASAILISDKDVSCNEKFLSKSHITDNGAIPKHKHVSSGVKPADHITALKSSGNTRTSTVVADVDSEDELLSELDATLTGIPGSSLTTAPSKSAGVISDSEPEQSKPEPALTDETCGQSCDQCMLNKQVCSWTTGGNRKPEGELAVLKRRLHKTQQQLVDKECDISRLKEDLDEYRERLETVVRERESCQNELDCRTQESSSDLYLPQIKELEYTIAQQQTEIRGYKDKLSSHDGAAKRAIAALQQEMKARVDQLMKRCEEATKEKDTMVVKFAQAEHKNLECHKQADRLEAKLKDMEKDRETFLTRMRAIKEQRTKLGADCEAKASEISNLNKELDKHRELVSSADVRVKWSQNKLKAELEAHKDTKVQLEKMTGKLKEAKEETQMIRQDCQAMIRTYQESEEVKSNSLDKELKMKESELLQNQLQKNNFELAHVKTQRELEKVKGEYKQSQAECGQLQEQVSGLEGENEEMKKSITSYTEIIQRQKKEIQEFRGRVETLVQYKTDFMGAQELIKSLDSEISELKISNKDLVNDMEACRRRENERLEVTEKLSRKNAELQSENTTLSNKVMSIQGELQSTNMEYHGIGTRLKDMADSLAEEQKRRQEESREHSTKFAGKCKAVEDLTRKVEEEKDEIRTLKRKHANNVKDLTRQLQQARRKLENYEANSNGDRDTVSMGSRTSSNGSLNTISVSESAGSQHAHPNGGAGSGSLSGTQSQRNPSPEQEYPVIVEQVEVDKQVLIERIVKLQRILAKRNEKVEFMDDHVSQLIDEVQKKNRIIQSYVLKEETGTMTSERRDQTKPSPGQVGQAEIARKNSIMGSVYSSHSNDGTMTLDLSLEINRKLQAVLEDTLLKNMTLKESLDTLGQEIARLSQENRQMQLRHQQQHVKSSRSRANPSVR